MVVSRQAPRRCLMLLPLALVGVLAGCAPALTLDPTEPLPVAYAGWAARPLVQTDTDAALVSWWLNFGDATLERLVQTALTRSLDLQLAWENVMQSRASIVGARSLLLPRVGVGAGATLLRNGGDLDIELLRQFGITDLHAERWQLGLQTAWEVDLSGQGRARLAAASDQERAAAADVQAVRLVLVAGVADTYLAYRGLQMQQQLLGDALALAEDVERIAERSFVAGVGLSTDADLARAEIAQLRAQLDEVGSAQARLTLALESLCGVTPGALAADLALPQGQLAKLPVLPAAIAPGQPADLLLRRPDLIAAEARFEASRRRGEMARANYWPRLSLGAVVGHSGLRLAGRDLGSSGFWMADLLLALPLFDFGARQSEVELADAQSRQAFLAYRQRARNALFEVEDALSALDGNDRLLAARSQATGMREAVLRTVLRQYEVGEVGRLDVIQARGALIDAKSAELRAQLGQLQAQVALYRTLGGGWQPYGTDAPKSADEVAEAAKAG